MASNVYVDEKLDMMCEGLFDNIDDLLDFSSDDELWGINFDDNNKDGDDDDDDIHICHATSTSPSSSSSFPSSEEVGSGVAHTSHENKACEEINCIDDWITDFLDESNFKLDFPATTAIMAQKDEPLFESFSPVSVLDEPNNLSNENVSSLSSSSSNSSTRTSGTVETVSLAPVGPTMMLVPARTRSKRPRRPALAHITLPILPPSTDGPPAVPTLLPETESFGESLPPPIKTKKKKTSNTNSEDNATVRKCLHCGIQKTPQWRAGPMGQKSLCNACGVRYKSGRLFPEYRPAASPTFVPSIHSNSHKKVIEMRNKTVAASPSPEFTPAAKNCDLLAYIRRS